MLKLIAGQHSAKDWNTLHARSALCNAPPEQALSDRVRGRYTGRPFTRRIIGHSGPAKHRQITIRIDTPVDVVRFENSTNLRP
nr:glyoxalase superfamily protein [Rhodobacter sp. 24-YEA-8]